MLCIVSYLYRIPHIEYDFVFGVHEQSGIKTTR